MRMVLLGRQLLGEDGCSLGERLTWKIVYFEGPFGSSSGAEQASFLSVKVVPPLWKKAVEATNTYIM